MNTADPAPTPAPEVTTPRTVLITGSGRGIGRAMALALARVGHAVAVQDMEVIAAEAVVAEIAQRGGRAEAFGGDVTDPALPEQLYSEVHRRLGPPDILINNAAVQEAVAWDQASPERLQWQWRGNVLTPWMLTRLCAPHMRQQRWGRVLFLSSIEARRGNPGMLGYSTTKAAVNNLVTGLAAALGPDGITVNAISPGYFDTHRNRDDFPDEATKQRRGQWLPLRRVGEPEDVVGLTLLLTSDRGSYITGQVIPVDGGMSIR